MSKISLLEQLKIRTRRVRSRPALVTVSGVLTFEGLCEPRRSFVGKRVAIVCSEQLYAVSALASNVGKAETITVFPISMPDDEKILLLDQGEFDVVLSDQPREVSEALRLQDVAVFDIGAPALSDSDDAEIVEMETEWLIPTSGTTSTPKLVKHTTASISKAINSNSDSSDYEEVWGLLYDLGRFAGIQVLLQSVFSGRTLVIPPENAPLEDRIAFLQEHGVTHISATPTLWRKILMVPESRFLGLRKITLGGEPVDQMILSALRSRYPQARITHVYASTEAGVGLWVSDGLAGFPRDFLQNSPGMPELDVRAGSLWVRSEGASLGYVSGAFSVQEGWVNTGDVVEIRKDRFFILGRGDQIINVGGDKVVADQVRVVLLECNVVADAFVFGRASPITGAIVAAEIALVEGQDPTSAKEQINEFLKKRLREPERPRIIRFVDGIAVNSTGKALAQNG